LIKKNIENCYSSNKKFVLADSSFYICFLEELKRHDCYNFFSYYDFCIGDKVFNELNSKKVLLDKPITHIDFEKLKYRSWTCLNCGIVHDRNVNAAKNILTVGRTGVKNILNVFSNAHSKTNI